MDWTHPLKTNDLYHASSLDLEPTGKESEAAKETPGAAIIIAIVDVVDVVVVVVKKPNREGRVQARICHRP